MPHRAPRSIAAFFAGAVAVAGLLARADPAETLTLEWNAPPECPTRADVLREVARLVGPTPSGADRLAVSARALLFRGEDTRWHVQITTLDGSGGERTLDAPSCDALTRATALVLALRINPSLLTSTASGSEPAGVVAQPGSAESAASSATPPAASTVPPEAAPAPLPSSTLPPSARPVATGIVVPHAAPASPALQQPSRNSLSFGALFLGAAGELPSVEPAGQLVVGFARGRLRVEARGQTGFVQHASAVSTVQGVSSADLGGGQVREAGGGARGCYGPAFGAVAILGCAGAEIDWMSVSGFHTARPTTANATWVALGVGAQGRWRLTRWVALRADVEGLVPLARPVFTVQNFEQTMTVGTVYQPGAVWGRLAVGAEVVFF